MPDMDAAIDLPRSERTDETANRLAAEFVDQFVNIDVPSEAHIATTRLM